MMLKVPRRHFSGFRDAFFLSPVSLAVLNMWHITTGLLVGLTTQLPPPLPQFSV